MVHQLGFLIVGSQPVKSEWLIVPVVTQQRVNTRLTVMITTSVLEPEELE